MNSHTGKERRGVFFYEDTFYRDEQGWVYSDGKINRRTLRVYLDAVDHLQVFCRIRSLSPGQADALIRIDDPRLSFQHLGLQRWPALAMLFPVVLTRLWRAWKTADLAILRAPSFVSILLRVCRWRCKKPLLVELVSDPRELLRRAYPGWPGVALLDALLTGVTRRWVAEADGCVYVTRQTLQRRYPCGGLSTHASNVQIEGLDDADLRQRLRDAWRPEQGDFRVGVIASLHNEYKGVDVAIRAISVLCRAGRPVRLVVLGEGALKKSYQNIAAALECAGRVEFAGTRRNGEQVRDWLRTLHVYIQPSRVEGLPRALVEAMSVALPCVATRVGGIPELLQDDWLVKAGDAASLADRIGRLLDDRAANQRQCQRNFDASADFLLSRIVERKRAFVSAFGAISQ